MYIFTVIKHVLFIVLGSDTGNKKSAGGMNDIR